MLGRRTDEPPRDVWSCTIMRREAVAGARRSIARYGVHTGGTHGEHTGYNHPRSCSCSSSPNQTIAPETRPLVFPASSTGAVTWRASHPQSGVALSAALIAAQLAVGNHTAADISHSPYHLTMPVVIDAGIGRHRRGSEAPRSALLYAVHALSIPPGHSRPGKRLPRLEHGLSPLYTGAYATAPAVSLPFPAFPIIGMGMHAARLPSLARESLVALG